MNTLYTFGCSFTSYVWPTWADIISYDLNMNLKNYGQCGLGNYGIAGRVLEVNESLEIDDSDMLMVLWSSWDREDRLKKGVWKGEGSVFCNDEIYGNKWLKSFYDDSDKIMKNIYYIHSTNKIYGKNINWQGSGFEYYVNDPYADHVPYGVDYHAKSVIERYGNLLPDLYVWKNAENRPSFRHLDDTHPDIEKHLELVQDVIYPAIGKEIKKETVDFFREVQYSIESARKFFKKYKKDEGRGIEIFLKENWIDLYQLLDKTKQPEDILR